MKLSVIIPVYNAAPYLRECLDSVCAAAEKVKMEGVGVQWRDRSFVEVICVDDGSTDGSGEILDEYRERLNVQTFEGADALKWARRTLPCRGFLWSYAVRREVVGGQRFRPAIRCKEDAIFLLELVPCLGRVRQVNLDGYRYCNVTTSLTKRKRKISQCVAYLNACREIWECQREVLATSGADEIARRSHFGGFAGMEENE